MDHGELVTLVTGSSKWRSLLIAVDGRRSVYDKKPHRYMEDKQQHLIVCSGKSEAKVTNNRRVRWRYFTV